MIIFKDVTPAGEMLDTDRIHDEVVKELPDGSECCLCKAWTMDIGMMIPDKNNVELFGKAIEEGKLRIVVYFLCEAHDLNKPSTMTMVERAIMRERN